MLKSKRGGGFITTYDFYHEVFQLINRDLIQELVNVTEIKYLKKGEFVVHIGEVLNKVYFLESGITRGYFLNNDGKEVTDCFSFQCGATAMPFCNMKLNQSSSIAIEVLEEGMFYCIPISVVIKLQNNLEIMRLYNRLVTKALNEHWKLKQILCSCSAVDRYKWFLQEYPGLIYKVSNKYIASFLGMTPVTLSRLRRVLRESEE